MIRLGYNDDKKGKWQSHTIIPLEDDFYNYEFDVYSCNPLAIAGYGATKEEALEDFMRKFRYVMDELKAFETMLYDSNVITDNIVSIDAFGHEIKE